MGISRSTSGSGHFRGLFVFYRGVTKIGSESKLARFHYTAEAPNLSYYFRKDVSQLWVDARIAGAGGYGAGGYGAGGYGGGTESIGGTSGAVVPATGFFVVRGEAHGYGYALPSSW